MCLTTALKKPKTAIKKIPIYKVLYNNGRNKRLEAPYMYTKWELDKVQNSGLGNGSSIQEGLHATTSITEGRRLVKNITNGVLFKGYIPKGAKYYTGRFGGYKQQVASSAMCVTTLVAASPYHLAKKRVETLFGKKRTVIGSKKRKNVTSGKKHKTSRRVR